MQAEIIQILVVDDNDDDIFMIKEAFADENLINICDVVYDGEQAMAYLRKEGQYQDRPRPGIVLLDINMPKKDGFSVLNDMKADPSLCDIPVVMLTTSARDEDVARSYCDGACSFITKPVNFEKFREVSNAFSLYWAIVARRPTAAASQEVAR